MSGLQVRVRLVLAVADAVVVERLEPARGGVRPQPARAALVDVVAEEDDRLDVPGARHVGVRREVPVGEVLAGDECERDRVDLCEARRRRARMPHGADVIAGLEAVEVLMPRSEALELDAHAVRLVGQCH